MGEGLVKQNKGEYRARYVQAKFACYQNHFDWKNKAGESAWNDCDKCKASGSLDGATCPTCGGSGKKCQRANLHGMLMATKRLLLNLWVEWRDRTRELPAPVVI